MPPGDRGMRAPNGKGELMGGNVIASAVGSLVVAASLCLATAEVQANCGSCGYSGYGGCSGCGGYGGHRGIGFNYPGYGYPAYRHFMYPSWTGYASPGY